MPIESIRLSQTGKDQLITLKRRSGISHWNVLCRWAFCLSLAEPIPPPQSKIPADSSIEMTWKVFGGPQHQIYFALLKERCKRDGFTLDKVSLSNQLRLHLHRGLGYMVVDNQFKTIRHLLQKVL